MPTTIPIGRLTESVTLLSAAPPAIGVSSLTSIGSVASAVTAAPHGLRSGDYASVRGALPLAYNTASAQVTVTSATQFAYGLAAGADLPPASGPITVTFTSDAQGGGPSGWYDVGQVFAWIEPLAASERLAVGGASAAVVNYRAIIHYRIGVVPKMKVRWTRYLDTPRELEIAGVYPHPDSVYAHRFLVLECGELAGG